MPNHRNPSQRALPGRIKRHRVALFGFAAGEDLRLRAKDAERQLERERYAARVALRAAGAQIRALADYGRRYEPSYRVGVGLAAGVVRVALDAAARAVNG